jgi:hypothetical protein
MGQRGAEKLLQYPDLALEAVGDIQLQTRFRRRMLLHHTLAFHYPGSRYEGRGK